MARSNRAHGLKGHVCQGRCQAFPSAHDAHLRTVVRDVERKPCRANLVRAAQDWHWCSLGERRTPPLLPLLHAGPVPLPADWTD